MAKSEVTFEDWFHQLEAYGLKSERFYESLDAFTNKNALAISMVEWLKAAYYAGKAEGDQIASYRDKEGLGMVMNETYGTKVYACYETDLTPWEGSDTLIAIFDTEKAAKEYVSRMDKAYGSEYCCYTYEVFYLNRPTTE